MNTDKMLAYIGRRITSFYALLADGDNTERTKARLSAKIEMLLELLDEFNIEYEFIGNNEGTERVSWYDFEGIIINGISYTYTIKNHAIGTFCVNEQEVVKCDESKEDMPQEAIEFTRQNDITELTNKDLENLEQGHCEDTVSRIEAIDILNALYNIHISDEYYNKDEYYGFSSQIGPVTNYDIERALKFSIKALEQKPILDKIKADIESMDFDFGDYYDNTNEIIEMVCKVIDKYKEENGIEKSKEWTHKPCINYEDGCEEWAGCPCVDYKEESKTQESELENPFNDSRFGG